MKYRHKHVKNKYRHLKPKRNLFTRPVFWLALLMLIIAGGAFYLFFFFSKFQVQVITVSGAQTVSSQNIQDLAWQNINKKMFGISNKSIFTVDAAALKKNLLTGFPDLETVSVQHQWLTGIHLEVTERSSVAVFCPNKSVEPCFLIDKHGVIYKPVGTDQGGSLIVRQMVDETKLTTGQPLVAAGSMNAIITITDDLQNNFQIPIREVFVSNPLIITTTEGWKLYFDPTISIDGQITKMDLLLKNTITPDMRKKLQYIYLQYKDRAYYK